MNKEELWADNERVKNVMAYCNRLEHGFGLKGWEKPKYNDDLDYVVFLLCGKSNGITVREMHDYRRSMRTVDWTRFNFYAEYYMRYINVRWRGDVGFGRRVLI